jgi:HK97 family phage portal protein
MKLLGLQIPFTKRAQGPNVADDRWFTPFLEGGKTEAGVDVTPESALKFSAVMSAVRIISKTVAILPLPLYKKRPDGGRVRAENHPVYSLLKTSPNPIQTSFHFRQMLTLHLLLRGNGYAQILRNQWDEPVQMWPIHPTRMKPLIDQKTGEKIYKYRDNKNQEVILGRRDVFHLQGLTDVGLEGMSPIAYARETIGLGLAAEAHSGKFYKNNAVPAGFLQMEKERTLSKEAAERLRDQWQEQYSGGKARGRVLVLEDGLKFEAATMTAEDAQTIQTRMLSIKDIARIYNIPPHMLGDIEKASYASIEQFFQEFLTLTMMDHLVNWEATITRDLLDGDDRKFFAEFFVNALLRGDTKTRMESYVLGRQNGIWSVNDVRRKENEEPIGPEGDVRHVALNQVPLGSELDVLLKDANAQADKAVPAEKAPPPEEKPHEMPVTEKKSQDLTPFEPLFAEIWERILRKELKSVRNAARKEGEKFTEWYATFRVEQKSFANECLRQAAFTLGAVIGRTKEASGEGLDVIIERYCQRMDSDVTEFFAKPEAGYELNDSEISRQLASEAVSGLVATSECEKM